jgi:Protein of unknown function (DUF1559)
MGRSAGKTMMIIAGSMVCCVLIATAVRLIESEIALQVRRHRQRQCESNFRKTALALLGCCKSVGSFPLGTVQNPDLKPTDRLGLYVPLSPYLNFPELYNSIDQAQPWNRDFNGSLARVRIEVLTCPNATPVESKAPKPTTSIGIAGLGTDAPLLPTADPRAGVFGFDRQTTLADIKDGAANTMMLAESGRAIGSWLQGGGATVRGLDPAKKPYIGPGRQFGGLHDGVAIVVMADGSVRFVSESVDPKVFEALSTMAGGEQVPAGWDGSSK